GGQVTTDAGDAHFQAVAVLAVDVGAAARVVPDQHRPQARHPALGSQSRDPFLELRPDCGRGSAPLQSVRGPYVSPLALVPGQPWSRTGLARAPRLAPSLVSGRSGAPR